MSWARLDDGFPNHPKVVAAGDDAGWLFVCGLCYACEYLTDGFIPAAQLPRLSNLADPTTIAERLLAVGLWEPAADGYQIHDFLEYNPPAVRVRAEREAARLRMSRRRSGGSSPEVPYINEGSSGELPPNIPRSSASPYPYPYPSPDPVPTSDLQPPVSSKAAAARARAGADPAAAAAFEDAVNEYVTVAGCRPSLKERAALAAAVGLSPPGGVQDIAWMLREAKARGGKHPAAYGLPILEEALSERTNGASNAQHGRRPEKHHPGPGEKARRDAHVVTSWTGTPE